MTTSESSQRRLNSAGRYIFQQHESHCSFETRLGDLLAMKRVRLVGNVTPFRQCVVDMADVEDSSAPPSKRAKLGEDSGFVTEAPVKTDSASAGSGNGPWTDGWARELECGLSTFINTTTAPFTSIFKHRFVSVLLKTPLVQKMMNFV